MSDRGNEKELVSVIIPTYNRLELLKRSVESVMAQTYENWELIVVDDCSEDGTKEYIESLKDSRVFYYRNEVNMGPAASRNVGASKAKGSLLAFQDSDDVWMPDKLAKTVEALLAAPAEYALVYHEVQEEDGTIIPAKEIPYENKMGNIFSHLLLYPMIDTPAAVIKKACFDALGGFCEALKSMEDYELFLRVSKEYPILFVREPLTLSHDTKDSVNKRQKDKIDTEAYVLKTMYGELKSRGLLQEKIAMIRMQAENYGCEDYAYEKLQAYGKKLKAAGEEDKAASVLFALEQVMESATDESTERRRFYQSAPSHIDRLTDSLERFAGRIKSIRLDLTAKKNALSALQDTRHDLGLFKTLFPESFAEESSASASENRNMGNIDTVLKQNLALARKLQNLVKEGFHVCASCDAQTLFIPVCKNDLRRADRCPYCGAYTGTRFLLGFLEDVQPEDGEKIVIGVAKDTGEASQLEEFIDDYTEKRRDMKYTAFFRESHQTPAAFDVLILKELPHSTGEWQKIRESLKPGGFFVTFDGAALGKTATETAAEAGFEETSIDINWFGEEYFDHYGFAPEMCLKMYTKAE